MGGCQTNIPCSQEIKSKLETLTIINNFNNKDIIAKDNKNILPEEPGVSNEEIKIALPVGSLSTTKNSRRNIMKNISDENINKNIKNTKRKSFNLTTDNKTPSTQKNYNTINDKLNFNLNPQKINKNKIEINNFGINNLTNNIIAIKKGERKNKNNQIMLNSLISNKNNIDNNQNKKILHNIDNNVINNINNQNNDIKKVNKNFSYENLQIEDIIPLINDNGELKNEMLFCVMSRINLKLYKNITFFLKMKKPLFIINLKLVKNIHIIKDASLGLCFSLLDKFIFTLNNKEQLFKWIVVLNYFSIKLRE